MVVPLEGSFGKELGRVGGNSRVNLIRRWGMVSRFSILAVSGEILRFACNYIFCVAVSRSASMDD